MKRLKDFTHSQSEVLPHGEFLKSFYVKNKVPYNIFQKWFKDIRKKVVEVQIDSVPAVVYEGKTRQVINLNLYSKAVITIPFS